MLISEIYLSRQGEGRLTGQNSIFVRTSGCNLRCDFCDTPYTSWRSEGNQMAIEDILAAVAAFDCSHVVLTGGEPMLDRGVVRLTEQLHAMDMHITIETAGTVFRSVVCDLMSISPKLANSTPSEGRAGRWSRRHELTRLNLQVIRQQTERYDHQLKFVIVNPDDIVEVEELLGQLPNVRAEKVMLMPEGLDLETLTARGIWLQSICDQTGYTFCPRMHIRWYGNKRGT